MVTARAEARAPGAGGRTRKLIAALVAAAAVLAALAAAHLSRDRDAGHREAHLTTEYLIKDHLAYARDRDRHAEVVASSPAPAQTFFETELSLAVRVPELDGATLTGARRCKVRGRPAALLFYEREARGGTAEPISLFVFEGAREDFSAMEEVSGMPGKRSCQHSARGISVVIWEERGLVHALAGALEPDELGALLAPR